MRSALSESGVSPERLVLEITEGVLIDNPDEMVKRIKDLHDLGVRVALDDFGSGYSNLGYLHFPRRERLSCQSDNAAMPNRTTAMARRRCEPPHDLRHRATSIPGEKSCDAAGGVHHRLQFAVACAWIRFEL